MFKALLISHELENFSDTMVTLLLAASISFGVDEVLAIVASCLAIVYWIPRLKKQIFTYNKGNLWEYIKDIFKKSK